MTQYQHIRRLITTEEYHKMIEAGILGENDKVELINGEILHKSPVGNNHASIITMITMLFSNLFNGKALVQIQSPITIKDVSEPEPDMALLKLSEDFYFNRNRLPKDTFLLIEVSDSTYEFDKTTKLKLYAQAGVPEYWIVNIPENRIDLHLHPKNNVYKNITIALSTDTISCASFPDIKIQVKDLLGQ